MLMGQYGSGNPWRAAELSHKAHICALILPGYL